jgi:phage-related protein
MPTIKQSLNFNYDGVWSEEYGVVHVVLDSGMYEETLVATRDINETKVRGNSKPMLYGVEDSTLSFDMTIAFEKRFTDDDVDRLIRWLFSNHYKPLYFEGKEDRVYYCMPTGDSNIIHNGLNEGYIAITMRCDSPYVYSQNIITPKETVSTTKTITLQNDGQFTVFPEISLKKSGNGKITIESLDDGGDIFEITYLANGEDIYLNCEKEIIESDAPGVYRYDKLNGHFPRINYGANRFKITGACTIQFRYKNIYRF